MHKHQNTTSTTQALLQKRPVGGLLCTLHYFMYFDLVLQLYVGEQKRTSSWKSSLLLLSASPNQALSDLIKEAKKAYECKFCLILSNSLVILGEWSFHSPPSVMKQLVSHIMWVMDLCSLYFIFPPHSSQPGHTAHYR